jgi:hypothetical protein
MMVGAHGEHVPSKHGVPANVVTLRCAVALFLVCTARRRSSPQLRDGQAAAAAAADSDSSFESSDDGGTRKTAAELVRAWSQALPVANCTQMWHKHEHILASTSQSCSASTSLGVEVCVRPGRRVMLQ